MRKAIVYASVHHGNTEKLVKGIAEECQVDLIDAVKQPDADLSSYDMIDLHQESIFQSFISRYWNLQRRIYRTTKDISDLYLWWKCEL